PPGVAPPACAATAPWAPAPLTAGAWRGATSPPPGWPGPPTARRAAPPSAARAAAAGSPAPASPNRPPAPARPRQLLPPAPGPCRAPGEGGGRARLPEAPAEQEGCQVADDEELVRPVDRQISPIRRHRH